MLFIDLKKFYVKDQCRSWFDQLAGLLITICQVRWDEQSPFAANRHELKGFCPASNHSIYGEINGLSIFYRAFKNGSVNERAFIMTFHFISSCRLWSGTFFQNNILQAAGKSDNPGFYF